MRFDGWTVVVTRAASGIGAATAEAFLTEGVIVIAGDQDPDATPEGCRPLRVDVSSEEGVQKLISDAFDSLATATP